MKILQRVVPKITQLDAAIADDFVQDAPSWAVKDAKAARASLTKFQTAADSTIKNPSKACTKSLEDLMDEMKTSNESLNALNTALANASLGFEMLSKIEVGRTSERRGER